jgi:hypothetical protein
MLWFYRRCVKGRLQTDEFLMNGKTETKDGDTQMVVRTRKNYDMKISLHRRDFGAHENHELLGGLQSKRVIQTFRSESWSLEK